jgi:hypothetical protein
LVQRWSLPHHRVVWLGGVVLPSRQPLTTSQQARSVRNCSSFLLLASVSGIRFVQKCVGHAL